MSVLNVACKWLDRFYFWGGRGTSISVVPVRRIALLMA